jgi:hypothetical protein
MLNHFTRWFFIILCFNISTIALDNTRQQLRSEVFSQELDAIAQQSDKHYVFLSEDVAKCISALTQKNNLSVQAHQLADYINKGGSIAPYNLVNHVVQECLALLQNATTTPEYNSLQNYRASLDNGNALISVINDMQNPDPTRRCKKIFCSLFVMQCLEVGGKLIVGGNTCLSNLCVRGNATVDHNLSVGNALFVNGIQIAGPGFVGGANVGGGEGLVFRDQTGGVLNFRSLLAGSNITITTNPNEIVIDTAPGVITTATNVGTGSGHVFQGEAPAGTLNFRTFLAGTPNISISDTLNEVVISNVGIGDVVGPGSSTNNAIALFDGTSGRLIKQSRLVAPVTIDGTNNIDAANNITMTGNLNLPNTTMGCTEGVITFGGFRFIHNYDSSPTSNIFMGRNAGNCTNTGISNIGIGNSSLLNLTTGNFNTALGDSALRVNTSGNSNTALGGSTLSSNTIGSGNTAIGGSSLFFNILGNLNTAVGAGALISNTVNANTAVGFTSLSFNSNGTSNTGVGYSTLLSNQGSQNTAMGNSSLVALTSGSTNIAVGFQAGNAYNGAESSNILIGNNGSTNENNTIRIGTSGALAGQQNKCFIAGITGVSIAGATVTIDGAGQLGVTPPSSRRYKNNITDMADASSPIMQLRPVIFTYKSDKTHSLQYGLIAEEVAEIMPQLVIYQNGQPETVKYHELPVLLLNEFQKTAHTHNQIEIQLIHQKSMVDELKRIIPHQQLIINEIVQKIELLEQQLNNNQ